MEPSRKIQRTFPPADIRDEALSVPNTLDKVQTTSQTDSSIQSKSSITFEPIKPTTNDITKPKVREEQGLPLHRHDVSFLGHRQCHCIFVAKICSCSR